jgi:hypothetical protein
MRVREGELKINYILPTTIRLMALASFHVLPSLSAFDARIADCDATLAVTVRARRRAASEYSGHDQAPATGRG